MGGSLGGVLGQGYHPKNMSRGFSWLEDIEPLVGSLGVCCLPQALASPLPHSFWPSCRKQ